MKLTALLFVISVTFIAYSHAVRASEADPVNAGDKAYFLALKDGILNNKKDWIADQIFFPLNVFPYPGKEGIKTKGDFLRRYDEIINTHVRREVQTQEPDNLFKNWFGLMVGDGAIWIVPIGDKNSSITYRIVTINNQPVLTKP